MALCWSVCFSSPERYPESFVRHFQVLPRSGCSPNYVLFFFSPSSTGIRFNSRVKYAGCEREICITLPIRNFCARFIPSGLGTVQLFMNIPIGATARMNEIRLPESLAYLDVCRVLRFFTLQNFHERKLSIADVLVAVVVALCAHPTISMEKRRR